MSNATASLFAGPVPSIGMLLVQVAENLARGVCPSCRRETIYSCWNGSQELSWFCNSCGFTLAYEPDESRQPTTRGELPQSLLWELFVLKRLEQQQKLIRSRVLAMSDAGRPVEPGHLGVQIRDSTRRQITYDVIRNILGQEALDTLCQLAPTIEIRNVLLGPAGPAFTASHSSEEPY